MSTRSTALLSSKLVVKCNVRKFIEALNKLQTFSNISHNIRNLNDVGGLVDIPFFKYFILSLTDPV